MKPWYAAPDGTKRKRKKGKTHLESARRAKFTARVKREGGETRKVEWYLHNGAPDQLVLFPGFHALVELKQDNQKPETHQLEEHNTLRAAGFPVWVINSDESFEAFFDVVRKHCG